MLAGMTAEISMQLDPRTDVLLIPTAAITYLDGEPSVTIADGETRQTIGIKLGTVTNNIAEVTSGNLTEGTQLIVSRIDQEVLLRLGLDPAEILGQSASVPAQIPEIPVSDSIYVKPSSVPPEVPAVIPTEAPTRTSADIPSPEAKGDPQEISPDRIHEQMPKELPSDAIPVKPSAAPSEAQTVTPTSTPAATPTAVPVSKENVKPQEITPTETAMAEGPASGIPVPENMPEGNPFGSGQMPFAGEDGQFPAMPEGMQMPSMGEGGQFPDMPRGQRPDMSENGQFRPPSGSQMPDMGSGGTFQRPSDGQRPGGDSSRQFPGAGQRPQGTVTPAGKPASTPAPDNNISDKG